MKLLASPGKQWAALAVASWLMLAGYIGIMVYLVGRFQPKLIADQNGVGVLDSLYETTGGRLYWILAPASHYNRYVVPALLVTAMGTTITAWIVRSRERVTA